MRTIVSEGGACDANAAARLRRFDNNAEIIILEAANEISIKKYSFLQHRLPKLCSVQNTASTRI